MSILVTRRGPIAPGCQRLLQALVLWLVPMASVLATERPVLEVRQSAWIEQGESADLPPAPSQRGFGPVAEGEVFPLGPGRTLWLRVEVTGAPKQWLDVDIPVPLLDDVVLLQQDAGGTWSRQEAGDHRPVANWFRPGRYPSFAIAPSTDRVRTAYLRVRHADPIGFEVRVASAPEGAQRRLRDYLALGFVLGCLGLFTALCITHAWGVREFSHALYAAYAAVMTLCIATITGVAGHLAWSASPGWNDAAQGAIPVVVAGVHVLFLQHLCATHTRDPRCAAAARLLAIAILAAAVAYPVASPQLQRSLVSWSLVLGLGTGALLAAGARLRHRDPVGTWVLLAYAPFAVAVALSMLRLNGWMAASWATIDANAAAGACAVPLLLLALDARTRGWQRVESRVNELTQQDALTGLLSKPAFLRQLDRTVAGAVLRHEPAAVALVEVANLREIRRVYGAEMAEQALLRSAIKLHRIVRESDPAGRVGTARFAVIFEGLRSRDQLQERMVRLVTSGLIPARGAELRVPLKFHAACVMLDEGVASSSFAMRKLGKLLDGMSVGTRRPVRFVEGAGGWMPHYEASAPSDFELTPLPSTQA